MQVESAEQEVLGALAGWLREGQHAWLCTIVEISGSSPRPLGSIMACAADGRVCGSLSGGCVEEDLIERLRAGELATAGPMLRTYGLSAAENERLGLPCGGRLGVWWSPARRRRTSRTSGNCWPGLRRGTACAASWCSTAAAAARMSWPRWSRWHSPTACCATRWGRDSACCWSARDRWRSAWPRSPRCSTTAWWSAIRARSRSPRGAAPPWSWSGASRTISCATPASTATPRS